MSHADARALLRLPANGTAADGTAADGTTTADPDSFVAYVQTAQAAVTHATIVLSQQASAVARLGVTIRRDFPLPGGRFLRVDGNVSVLRRTRRPVFGERFAVEERQTPTAIDQTKPAQVAAFLAACAKARKWLDGLPAAAEAKWVRDRKRHAAAIETVRAAAAEAALAVRS